MKRFMVDEAWGQRTLFPERLDHFNPIVVHASSVTARASQWGSYDSNEWIDRNHGTKQVLSTHES
jgi:hypothetical protein